MTESEKSRILGMHYNAMGKSLVSEEIGEPGTIKAIPRGQNLVDEGMNYIGFDYYGENNTRKSYYYQCTPYVYSTKEAWNVPGNRAGDFTDANGDFVTPQQIGELKGDYKTQLKNACQNIYTFYNNYKKTFCADPKNKTKDAYKFLCPQETPQPQVAAATTTTVAAPNPVSDADVEAKQKTSQQTKLNTEQAKQKLTDKMADTNYLNPNKEKAELDKDVLEVYSLITSATPIGGELELTVKNRVNRLLKYKPEYKQEPYGLSSNMF